MFMKLKEICMFKKILLSLILVCATNLFASDGAGWLDNFSFETDSLEGFNELGSFDPSNPNQCFEFFPSPRNSQDNQTLTESGVVEQVKDMVEAAEFLKALSTSSFDGSQLEADSDDENEANDRIARIFGIEIFVDANQHVLTESGRAQCQALVERLDKTQEEVLRNLILDLRSK